MVLYNSYTKCLNTLKSHEKNFQEFNKCINLEHIEKWQAMDTEPWMVKKKVVSIHIVKFKNGMFIWDFYLTTPEYYLPLGLPTQASTYKALLQEEILNNLVRLGGLGETQFINNDLRLEFHQYVLYHCLSFLG